ncbi:MAG TPA: RNA-binding protein, partial [Candidatus Polarisedimenticolia bacterium]|nr:RNA-binding protein [Candidatus Polarisedimenticolia bacterium]
MLRKLAASLAAIVLSVLCYAFARLPVLAAPDAAALASRYAFERLPVAEASGHPPYKSVRAVHPSLERISAWVSSLGAAATLADLDGDGLPDDLVLVDPRTDRVTVSPAPGTSPRFEPFELDTSAWAGAAYDPAALAPMGTLAGDFNEDGAPDL